MEILYEYSGWSDLFGIIIFVCVSLTVIFFIMSLAYSDSGNDSRSKAFAIVSFVCVLVVIFTGLIYSHVDALSDEYVEAVFDDSYPFSEVVKEYVVVQEQRGKIYTLMRKSD